MQIILDIPEELLTQLALHEQSLPDVLEIGLHELAARPKDGFTGFAEVLEFLADLPTPEAILALRPSEALQAQINRLSEKHQAQELTPQEQQLWQHYEYLEHIIRMAKTKAYVKLHLQNAG